MLIKKLMILLAILMTYFGANTIYCCAESEEASEHPSVLKPPTPTGTIVFPAKAKISICHWVKEQMPIKIYISPGLILPGIEKIDNRDIPIQSTKLRNEPRLLEDLPKAKAYSRQYSVAVQRGIELWRPSGKQDVFSFEFTKNSSEANVLVFGLINYLKAEESLVLA